MMIITIATRIRTAAIVAPAMTKGSWCGLGIAGEGQTERINCHK